MRARIKNIRRKAVKNVITYAPAGHPVRTLRELAKQNASEVEMAVSKSGIRLPLHSGLAGVRDRYRLLALRVWAEKYGVSLQMVVNFLVAHWRRRSKRWSRGGIGFTIPLLCGAASERILVDHLKELGLHGAGYAEVQRRLDAVRKVPPKANLWFKGSLRDAVTSYRTWVMKQHSKTRRVLQAPMVRPYRRF